MYRAKSRGGARYELFDEAMHTQAVTRLLTERALREALERDELRVLFQPQFDLATGDAGRARRHCCAGRTRCAASWRPATSSSRRGDRHHRADRRVGARPGRASARAAPDATGPTTASSACRPTSRRRQLLRADFPELGARRAARLRPRPVGAVPGDRRARAARRSRDHRASALSALKDLGVRLAIDDFGTGGSSLTYLRRFPFDELKIDRAFVAGLGQSAADDAIVAATIDMAHALGMVVAAEGVETEVQRVPPRRARLRPRPGLPPRRRPRRSRTRHLELVDAATRLTSGIGDLRRPQRIDDEGSERACRCSTR